MQNLVLQLHETNTDTILDLGLSKFMHREKFRVFADENNIALKLHFLDISKETRLERVFKRNKEKGATYEFEVSKENFDFMESWFERPTEIELKGALVVKD